MNLISEFTGNHVTPLLSRVINNGIVLLPALQVACAACRTRAEEIARKIEENPTASTILQNLGNVAIAIRHNSTCQTFTSNCVGSVASLIPQTLAPYLRTCSCLAGASATLSNIAYAGINGMKGRAQEELAKPLPAQMAGALGRGVVSGEQLCQAGLDAIGGPVGNHLAAQAVHTILSEIEPQALNLITKTSTISGGLEFLQGLFHLTNQLGNLANPVIQKGAKIVFHAALAYHMLPNVIQNFCNGSTLQKIKQLAQFAFIVKVAQIAHSKYKMDPWNVGKVMELLLLLKMPKTTAAMVFAKALGCAGVVGGSLGVLGFDEKELREGK